MSVSVILAHGLGGRSDLPVPLWMAIYGAAAAVLVSFFALGAFWRSPRFERDEPVWPVERPLQAVIDHPVTRAVLRLLGLLSFAATILVLAFGDGTSARNPGPTWFYVWFWVGLVPVSLLLGPVWRALNPLRTIAAGLARVAGMEDEYTRPYPSALGLWPAAASLGAFIWLELVYPRSDDPTLILIFIGLYSLVHIAGGLRYGQRWFARADGFEAYSTLLGRLSFFGRQNGRIVVRNPFRGLANIDPIPGTVAFVSIVLGSTAFDGLTRTQWWQALSEGQADTGYLLLGTAGLVGCVAFVMATFTAGTTLDERVLPEDARAGSPSLQGRFVHSLIPIAVGYTIAHYFSLLVFQGQAGLILASDPLSSGWDLFGTAGWSINYLLVSTRAIALVQVAAIVAGHIAGVVAAHDRAVAIFSGKDKQRAQYPLLGIMVLYTCGGIFLLVGT